MSAQPAPIPPFALRPTGTGLADPGTFAAVYADHAAEVFRIALGILSDRDLAEDLTHDVFLEVWRRPDRFDVERGDLGGFLRMLARSRAVDAWRRSARVTRMRERYEHELATAPEHGESALEAADRGRVAPLLRAAVHRLPPSQRSTVTLAYWGGLSAAEIAEHSGVPLGTVKSRLRLGLLRLARDPAAAAAAA